MLIFITGILLYPHITGILLHPPIFCLLSTSFNYIETANLLTKPLSNVKIPTSLPWWMWFRLIMGLEWFLTQIPARALPLISLSSYCPYIKVKILILCKIICILHSAEYTLQQREWGVHKPVHNPWQIGQRFHSLWSCSVWWLDRPLHLTHRLQNPLQTEEHIVNS